MLYVLEDVKEVRKVSIPSRMLHNILNILAVSQLLMFQFLLGCFIIAYTVSFVVG